MITGCLDFILPFFCGLDQLRPQFNLPSADSDGKYVYATNAHMIIRVLSENLAFKYAHNNNFPNVTKVYEEETNVALQINVNELIILMASYKWQKQAKTEVCSVCEGEGVIECKCCGNDVECKKCKGDGDLTIGAEETERLILMFSEERRQVKIGSVFFDANWMHALCLAAKFAGEDTIIVRYNSHKKAPMAFFEAEKFSIMIASDHVIESDEDCVKHLCVKRI